MWGWVRVRWIRASGDSSTGRGVNIEILTYVYVFVVLSIRTDLPTELEVVYVVPGILFS